MKTNKEYWSEGTIPWFTVEDKHKQGSIISDTVKKINKICVTDERIVPKNSVLLCCTASIGEVVFTKIPLTTNQQFNGISVKHEYSSFIDPFYLFEFCKTLKDKLLSMATSTTFGFVSVKKVSSLLFPLPPLEEQERIIKRIEELMPLVDEYASLEAKDKELNEKLPAMLKQSILQYAMEGKLVKQDPNDEPASVLLERIKAEKEKLIKEGKIKRDKNETVIVQDDDKNYYEKSKNSLINLEIPFHIPVSWKWIRIKDFLSSIQYGYNASAVANGKAKFLRISDISNGKVNWNTVPYCVIDENSLNSYKIKKNDIFIARTGGTIGKSFFLQEDITNVVFAGYLIRFRLIDSLFADYVYNFMQSTLYWNQVTDKSVGTGQPNINGVSLGNLLIPIPPINEKTRIIDNLNKINKLIDHLFY